MSCKRFMRQIPLAVGQDLGVAQQRSFDAHLRRCLSCYREFRDYTDALSALDPIRAPASFEAPSGLSQAIMEEVRANEAGPLAPHPTPIWSRSSRSLRYGLPLAAAVTILALAGIFARDGATNGGADFSGHGRQIPKQLVEPVVGSLARAVNAPPNASESQADQLGPAYVFPKRFHPGRLRLVGPVSSRKSEPLPSVVVPISKRNDF